MTTKFKRQIKISIPDKIQPLTIDSADARGFKNLKKYIEKIPKIPSFISIITFVILDENGRTMAW